MNKKNYVKFTDSYTDTIYTSLGSWLKLKSTDGGIIMDILNNLPLMSYNYEYKSYVHLGLNSIMFNPDRVCQAVDIVMGSISYRSGYPRDTNKGVVVHSRKELINAIVKRKSNDIYIAIPKLNPSLTEQLDFYNSMVSYVDVITRYLYIQSIKKLNKIINIIYG